MNPRRSHLDIEELLDGLDAMAGYEDEDPEEDLYGHTSVFTRDTERWAEVDWYDRHGGAW